MQLQTATLRYIETNITQGIYGPYFFGLQDYFIKKLVFNSIKKNGIEHSLLHTDFSFTYLQDNKLNIIYNYDENNAHIQFNDYSGKITDGISLISLRLVHLLGWGKARPGRSAQFNLFFRQGMVKGNCVVSNKIRHDVVIYGEENIKREILLNNGYEYITLEPLKLGKTLRLDVQSQLKN